MRFSADDYREAAGERLNEADGAYQRGEFVAAHLAAGLAIECMLRAYMVRVAPDFDARHDLNVLAGPFLRQMTDRRRAEARAAIDEANHRWRNNHRYCSAHKLRSHFNRIKLYGRERDMLRANAGAMIGYASVIVEDGERQWQTP